MSGRSGLLKFILILLGCVVPTMGQRISDMTATTSPSTNSWIEVADLNATPKTRKYLITNLVTVAQIDTLAELEAFVGAVNIIAATEIDSANELEALLGAVNVILGTEIDTTAKINALTTDDDFATLTGSQTLSSKTLAAPTITGAIVFPDNTRQTFNPGANAAGLNVGSHAGDPDTPSNGDIWYDSVAGELTARIAGANVALGAGGGGGGVGDVTAAAVFGTDNVLIRSDGVNKGVQGSNISISDTDDITIPGSIIIPETLSIITEGATADDFEGTITSADVTADRTWTFPDRTGIVALSGDTLTGDVTGTLDTDGSTVLTIEPDSVSLGTDTTGDYVDDVLGTAGQVTVTHTPGEGSAATISLPDAIDIGDKTSFELPNSTAPTTDAAGEIALDTSIVNHKPLLQYYTGVDELLIPAFPRADLPSTDNHVLVYDAAGDKFTWEAQSGGGGGSGDVTAAANFGTDNVLVRSDGTLKGVQSTGISVDDSDNMTVPGSISAGAGALSIIVEGVTADAFEGTITSADPTADLTWTLPDRSGTFSLSGDTFTGDVTGTLDTDGSTALTVAADSVALGTDTTGNYAAGDAEGGAATSGDNALGFFTTGQIERARGGTGADTSAYGTGLFGSDGANATIDVDTEAEIEAALGGLNLITSTEAAAGYQPLDADLTAVAALTTTAHGLGLLDDADATASRASIGAVIGTDVQAYDADLGAVAGLAANGLVARTGAGTASARTITGTSGRITVTDGDGVAGNPTLTLPDTAIKRSFPVQFNGGGAAPSAGAKGYWRAPVAGTITKITLAGDISGSAVVDIWKDTHANYPPTVADTICNSGGGGTKPTLSSALTYEDSTFTSWSSLTFNAGEWLGFNLDSASTLTVATLFVEWIPQ